MSIGKSDTGNKCPGMVMVCRRTTSYASGFEEFTYVEDIEFGPHQPKEGTDSCGEVYDNKNNLTGHIRWCGECGTVYVEEVKDNKEEG